MRRYTSLRGGAGCGDGGVPGARKLPEQTRSAGLIEVRTRSGTAPDEATGRAATGRLATTVERSPGSLAQTGATSGSTPFDRRHEAPGRMSARDLIGKEYTRRHDVAGGFEGLLDDGRHRRGIAGREAATLSWASG